MMRSAGLAASALLLLAALPASGAGQPSVPAPADRRAPLREVNHLGVRAIVAHVRPTQSDLAAFQLVNRETGAVLRVYYEPTLRQLAAQHLPYLAWMIDEVARRTQADAGQVIWASVVFTTDPDYSPPRAGSDTRWTVLATADGQLSPRSEDMLFGVIPHEQVHAVQLSMQPRLPRWFAEGQASWIGLQISDRVRPAYAASERRKHAEAYERIEGPLDLGAWGGVRPRREAIRRQVNPEDQARMDREPSFVPSGSFSFGPGDFEANEVDQTPRYAASLRLFEDMERQAGLEGMMQWQHAVWANAGPPHTQRLVALAQEHLGRSIEDHLR